MPIYHKLGNIPPKRHTQFEKPNGGLYYEQLFGTANYKYISGVATLLSDVVNFNGALQCVVAWDLDVKTGGKNDKNNMKLIATSLDDGAHWYFTEVMDKDVDQIQVGGFSYYGITLEKSLLPYFKKPTNK